MIEFEKLFLFEKLKKIPIIDVINKGNPTQVKIEEIINLY